MEKLYTCKEIAERYGVKVQTVWEWIRTHKLSAIKIGRLYRVTDACLKIFESGKEG